MVTLHSGIKVPIEGELAYYGPFSYVLVINRGVHEPLEEFVFQEVLKRLPENPVMLELGSYWAHYSMWFLSQHPGGRSYLVESEERSIRAGLNNFKINNFQGKFLRAFVGAGRLMVDSYLKDQEIDHLTILHSDIQGHESEMLDGARECLSNHRADYVFISTHSDEIHDDCKAKMLNYGYRLEVESGFSDHTTSYDGILIFTSPKIKQLFNDFRPMGRQESLTATFDEKVEYVRRVKNSLA
ncbi:MAG TPA: hypothetical protein PLO61_09195 [Fimbriimonadaceae bacterium]|nr:hypothetical protein [Fimbriimonadaceae bacterium]